MFMDSCQSYKDIRFGVIHTKGIIEIKSREISKNFNDKTVIKGYIYTLEDTLPALDARVWIDKYENAILADKNGYFHIETEKRKCIIKFLYVGYTEENLTLKSLEKNEEISIVVRLGAIIQ